GPENGFTTMARLDVGRMMNLRGRQKDAVAELEEVLAIRIRVDGAGNYWVQETRSALAEALLATGNLDRAQLLVDEALTASASKPKQNIRTLLLRTRAAVARQQHRMQDALNDVEAAEQINEGIQGPGSLRAATLLAARGETLLGLGRVDEAVAVLGEARKLLTRTETDPHRPEQMNVRIAMAMAQSAAGQRETARQQIMSVLDELGALPGREELWLLEEHAQQELAAVLFAQGKTDPACNALDAAMALRQSRSLADDARLTKMAAQRSSKGCRSMRVI
ncbi:MAG TPA: tetratricopeptide repeat protein, partial [Povalibacter sp.]|nr:tetratricopeptide repeat protein [Povalibacter sp.]